MLTGLPMPFIQDRSAFLQSKSHDRQADCSGGGHESHAYFPESSRDGGADPSARYPGLSASTLPSSADDPFAGAVLGLADVVTKLVIAHPCMVLRRQCQVHQNARSLHLTPFTLVPVVCNMVANEGIMTFWKGSVGSCVLWGLSNVTEIVLADLFGLPRHIVPNGSTAKYWKHILLKASAVLALTPFFVSTFTETVRSESGLGGEGPSVMEVLVRGIDRLRFPIFGSKDSSRRFSVLHLAAPTVFYRTSHYIIQRKLYYQFFKMARKYVNKKPEAERKKFHQYIPQMFAQTSSTIVTDLILFPVETIMHRMYIQGTRTLIDNLDTGLSAISITAKYSGFVDCFRSVFQHEGFCALYSGVGALALEYLLHSLLHQAVRACFDRGSEVLRHATKSNLNTSIDPGGSISSPFAGTSSGTVSGPATQSMSPVISPRKQHSSHTPPIRDPTQFPTFGESVSQLDSSLPTSTLQFPFHSNRPNAFGSPPRSVDRPSSSDFLATHFTS